MTGAGINSINPDGAQMDYPSHTRRIQHLRQLEQQEELETHALNKKKLRSQVWRPKPKGEDKKDDRPSTGINMVFMLPKEFMISADSESDEELGSAQLALDPMMASFEKPEKEERQHLKALFLKGYVNGKPVTRLLVDGGATVNLMPYVMLRKFEKSEEDLTKTDMILVDFEGNVSNAIGAICLDLTIDSKTLPTTFFVIKGKGSYNLLLGRDWIHANCCIPSTMH